MILIMESVFIIISVNFNAPKDTSVMAVYSSLESAMKAALEDVINCGGKNIKSHHFEMEGIELSTLRISNNNSLGSNYGITYNSQYDGYPCCRMVIERIIRS